MTSPKVERRCDRCGGLVIDGERVVAPGYDGHASVLDCVEKLKADLAAAEAAPQRLASVLSEMGHPCSSAEACDVAIEVLDAARSDTAAQVMEARAVVAEGRIERAVAYIDSSDAVELPWAVIRSILTDAKGGEAVVTRLPGNGPSTSVVPAFQLNEMEAELTRLRGEVERLRSMSTVEMMCENLNVKHHVEEWETRCLAAESRERGLREALQEIKHHNERYRGDIRPLLAGVINRALGVEAGGLDEPAPCGTCGGDEFIPGKECHPYGCHGSCDPTLHDRVPCPNCAKPAREEPTQSVAEQVTAFNRTRWRPEDSLGGHPGLTADDVKAIARGTFDTDYFREMVDARIAAALDARLSRQDVRDLVDGILAYAPRSDDNFPLVKRLRALRDRSSVSNGKDGKAE